MLHPTTLAVVLAVLAPTIVLPSVQANSNDPTNRSIAQLCLPHGTPCSMMAGTIVAQAPTPSAEARLANADRLLELGTTQYRTGQPTAAIASLQQALALYQALTNQPKIVKTLRNLGNAYYVMADYGQATAYYQQSLKLAQQTQNREGEAAALGNLGVITINLGDTQKAEQYYQQALTIYRQIKDRQGEGQTIGNLGEIALNQGDYPAAIAAYQQAITIARETDDPQLAANSIGNLAIIYYNQTNYTKAIELSQQQLTLARRLNNSLSIAAALNNLGNTYFALGDYGRAIDHLEQRLTLAQQIHDRLGESQALGNLSNVYYDLGDYTKVIDYAFKGLTLAQTIQNPAAVASFQTKLGNLYYVLQDFPNAIAYHQKRLALAQATHDLAGVEISLVNLGNVYKSMGQYDKAIALHEQALALARQLQDRPSESTALANLGVEYDDLGDYAKAVEYHQQALAIARATHDLATVGLVLNNLGNTQFRSGNLAAAETTLKAGLDTWESLRSTLGNNDRNQISIFDQQARTYRLLQRVLVAANKTDAALEIAERGRARAFVALLSRRLAVPGPPTAAPTIPSPTLAQIKQIAKAQNTTLVEYSITYLDRPVEGKIKPHEADLLIWVIAPNGTITFRKVDLSTLKGEGLVLDDLVTTSRNGIGVRGRGLGIVASADVPIDRDSHVQQLYQLLIQPIAAVLPQDPNARVTFIPQRSLFLVPFAALQDPSGHYLIEQHTILTAPSIQVLGLTQQQRQRHQSSSPAQRGPALVVGNPTMPTVPATASQPAEQLPSLPGAEREARAIASLLGTQAITGNQATKVAIVKQLPQMQFVHLATHGLLDDFKGLGIPGAIALAPSGQDNGLLTADEILDLKLQARLVVLSACDTGRGRITGDGVIGLSRSFISAGVPSLIVSLWSVPDAPTAALMTEFYQTLQHHPDKAQALRQAMLTTLKQYPNPRDWAAFTLIGEP